MNNRPLRPPDFDVKAQVSTVLMRLLIIGGCVVVALWLLLTLLTGVFGLPKVIFQAAYLTGWIFLFRKWFGARSQSDQWKAVIFSALTWLLLPIPFLSYGVLFFLHQQRGTNSNVGSGGSSGSGSSGGSYQGTQEPGGPRGSWLAETEDLGQSFGARQAQSAPDRARLPLFEIGGIQLPNELENLGFFMVGSPGSGKTQAIKKLLATMRERNDFRVMVLDRNGEMLEAFYREGRDLLFNPKDARSVSWNHLNEGMEPETIAAALVPDEPDAKNRFFSEAAKSLLSDLYERCDSNAEVWDVIATFSMQELSDFLKGGVSARYFGSDTGSDILSTLVNQMRFYRSLVDEQGFSFSQWGRSDIDPRWIFCSIFEDDAELFKPLYSMAFELMLRGMLGHPDPESRRMKTAIVIDELGALNQLRSLPRLLSEARKFQGTAILGTQTEAQIDRAYGQLDRRSILQGTATKLILNCRDYETAELMANTLGKHEKIEVTKSVHWGKGLLDFNPTWNQQIRETYIVMPNQLQTLSPLEGYLLVADGSPPAKVKLQAQGYLKQAQRFVPSNLHRRQTRPIAPSASGESSTGSNSRASRER